MTPGHGLHDIHESDTMAVSEELVESLSHTESLRISLDYGSAIVERLHWEMSNGGGLHLDCRRGDEVSERGNTDRRDGGKNWKRWEMNFVSGLEKCWGEC